MKHIVFITGGAGYIGTMLAHQYAKREDVEKIICLDRDDKPVFLEGISKIIWVKADMSDDTWQEKVTLYNPPIV